MNFLAYILILLLSASIVRIGPTEVAVVYQRVGGDPSRNYLWQEPLGPGTHFIIPFVNVPTIYSTERRVFTLAEADAIAIRTKDAHELFAHITIIYRVNPADVNTLYTRWGTRFEADFVRPTVQNVVRRKFGLYTEDGFYRQ